MGAPVSADAVCSVDEPVDEPVDECGCPPGTGWSTTGFLPRCCKLGAVTQPSDAASCQARSGPVNWQLISGASVEPTDWGSCSTHYYLRQDALPPYGTPVGDRNLFDLVVQEPGEGQGVSVEAVGVSGLG